MSSLICEAGKCTFTRVDTDGHSYGIFPPDFPIPQPYPETLPEITLNQTDVNGTDDGDEFFPPWDDEIFNDNTLAPWTDKENQDMISDTVAITRDFRGGIFNAILGQEDQWNEYRAPTGTKWALLPENKTFEEVRCELKFCSWLECFVQYKKATEMLNKPGVVHLVEEDEYYNIVFTNWTSARDDSSYYRRLKQNRANGSNGKNKSGRRTSEAGPGTMSLNERKKQQSEDAVDSEPYPYDGISYYPHEDDDYYGGYGGYDEFGGGFQYVRDAKPIELADDLPPCPMCKGAVAMPAVLTGPVDEKFQEISIVGVTPEDAEITIKAVGQDRNPRCNIPRDSGEGMVRPNAKGIGNSTAMLRRTRVTGELAPFRYTVFYRATTNAGSCDGQVEVCSPLNGFDDCNDHFYGYDATATQTCGGDGRYYGY